ncbi:LPS export ABC transporter periplasmic protein LptC, partial [Falsiroseomonas oryziterrae]|uniref:LPS export ABC transporter periplasmic protein LptC n=1 Tax=Falsiroseomonas oryziterrae TaxID=2911368 RepID=UPI001F02DB86
PSRRRRPPSQGQLARRRIAVAVAKRLLPVAAVALLASIALWPEFESAADRGRVAFKRAAEVRADALHIVEPRYQGVDEQNRPYTVTASVAVQAGNGDIVDLQAPRADLQLSDGGWVYLEAEEGRYDRRRNWLDLSGRVTIHHDDGTQFVTESASLDIATGDAAGDAPVASQGPFGTLTAQGFRLYDRGQRVVFNGQSRAVLEGSE